MLSAEVLPPDRADRAAVVAAARAVREAGARVLFFPDAPGGRARVDAIAAAAAVRGELGGPCVAHVNCRDRNRVALEAALLTAAFAGIDGIKAVTGDPVCRDIGQGVYDVGSVGLVGMAVQQAKDLPVFVGHTVGHTDPAGSEARLREKLEVGAHAVVTTPTLDADDLLRTLDRLDPLPVPLLVGLTLIPSSEVLDYLCAELPAFRVPDRLRAALAGSTSPADALQRGLDAAVSVAEAVRDRTRGFHVVPAFGRWQGAVPLLKAL